MFFPGSLLCFPSARPWVRVIIIIIIIIIISFGPPCQCLALGCSLCRAKSASTLTGIPNCCQMVAGSDTSFASVCPFCPGVALDSLCHYAVSCRHGGDIVISRNKLRDIIADLCRKAHLSVRVEAGHGMCRDNNHSCPADVLVEGWERGQPAALDITVTSPLTPFSLKESSRFVGVALSAETRKLAANDPKCR